MNTDIVAQAATDVAAPSLFVDLPDDIQLGPPFHCWTCGEKSNAAREQYFEPWVHYGYSHLDAWARHIYYLAPSCTHSVRCARLGDCITPLHLPSAELFPDQAERARIHIAAIQIALEHIAICVPKDRLSMDDATRIVVQLMAQDIAPATAIEAIRRLIRQPAGG